MNGHPNDPIPMRWDNMHKIQTSFLIWYWLKMASKPMWHIKEKEDLRFDHLHLLHLNFNPELWNDNLCDSQLLNEWANFQLNPTPMNAFRVGNVHINPYLLGPNIHYLNTFVGVTTAPKTSSHPHIACWSSQPLLGSNSAIFFPPQSFPHVNPTLDCALKSHMELSHFNPPQQCKGTNMLGHNLYTCWSLDSYKYISPFTPYT